MSEVCDGVCSAFTVEWSGGAVEEPVTEPVTESDFSKALGLYNKWQ